MFIDELLVRHHQHLLLHGHLILLFQDHHQRLVQATIDD
jgi:hypothetical protein